MCRRWIFEYHPHLEAIIHTQHTYMSLTFKDNNIHIFFYIIIINIFKNNIIISTISYYKEDVEEFGKRTYWID